MSQALTELFHQFERKGEFNGNLRQVAEWLVRTRQYQPTPTDQIELCRQALARALREEHMTDQKGRRVRVMHPVRRKAGVGDEHQTAIWKNIRTAPREHMEMAFAQRRRQIVGDCAQLKTDVDYFNDRQPGEDPIQIPFDFTEDLREIQAGAEAA